MIKPQTLKGFRDFLPEEARKRQFVINTLKQVFESYGFEPLETPALEYEEILLGKYGREGDKLMYRFEDNGKRKVALRYDQTVPLARVVAQYQNQLPMPFKRYQIQNVWRAENTQKGRFREFLQCDADIVGSSSVLSDLEILACINTAMKNLGFQGFSILVNSRKVFDMFGANKKIISILDKEDKIGKDKVLGLLSEVMESDQKAEEFYSNIKNLQPKNIPDRLKEILEKSDELNLFPAFFLARGLDYYTDLIFEVKIPKYKGGSVCGGGRYDNLIGMFAGKQVPAVGFAFGFDRLIEAMEQNKLFPANLQTTKVLVTIFPSGSEELKEKSIDCSLLLRSSGVSTELYLDENAKMEKQLKYADQKGIPYVIIIGPEEASKNLVTLRNMKTSEQKIISLDEALSVV